MPWIKGKFYMNPSYGRALEGARSADERGSRSGHENGLLGFAGEETGAHWVTINGHHVLIQTTSQGANAPQRKPGSASPKSRNASKLSARDKAYLDAYYEAVNKLAKDYGVSPALVLGVGIESGFGSFGTYLRTGDAFGMTGGSTEHMTTASTPAQNVQQFFDNYGRQIRGAGSDSQAFINGLEGLDSAGRRVKGWRVYNSDRPESWRAMIREGIGQMQRDIPVYEAERTKPK